MNHFETNGPTVSNRLSKRDFNLLGRVFETEALNLLPAQIGKSKAVASLRDRGYIIPYEKILSGRFPVTVRGWALTERGRIIYCENCTDERVAS